jgi:hypothetical protein
MHVQGRRYALTALLLAGLGPATTRAQGDPCAEEQPDERGRSNCARALYSRRDYVAAARHYERLWLDIGTPKYLYNAAAAREAAGHLASALALWTRYEASPGVEGDERAELKQRLDEMRARLVATTVTVTPADVLGPAATFVCQRAGGIPPESFEIPAHLVADDAPGAFTLFLDPGDWELTLLPASAIPEYSRVSAPMQVTRSPGQVELPLTKRALPDARPVPPERDVQRLTLGLGGGSAGVAVLGIIVLATNEKPDPMVATVDTDEAKTFLRRVGLGAGLLGAAFGLGAAAGLETLALTRRRQSIQLGVGGGLAFGGLVAHLAVWRAFHDDSKGSSTVTESSVNEQRASRGISAAVLGAGATLMAGVGLSYLVRVYLPRQRQRVGLGGLVHPRTVGLALTGRF